MGMPAGACLSARAATPHPYAGSTDLVHSMGSAQYRVAGASARPMLSCDGASHLGGAVAAYASPRPTACGSGVREKWKLEEDMLHKPWGTVLRTLQPSAANHHQPSLGPAPGPGDSPRMMLSGRPSGASKGFGGNGGTSLGSGTAGWDHGGAGGHGGAESPRLAPPFFGLQTPATSTAGTFRRPPTGEARQQQRLGS